MNLMRPSMITGYESASYSRKGASSLALSLTSLLKRNLESPFINPEKIGFKSPNRRAKARRLKKFPAFTPSLPSYLNSRFSPEPSLPSQVFEEVVSWV